MKAIQFLIVSYMCLTTNLFAQNTSTYRPFTKGQIIQEDGRLITIQKAQIMGDEIQYTPKNSTEFLKIPLSSVWEVREENGSKALEWGAILGGSALVGSLLGVAQAEAEYGNLGEEVNATPIVAGMTGLGVLIGVAIGNQRKKYKTVYGGNKGGHLSHIQLIIRQDNNILTTGVGFNF